jgi:hypothetical protein
MTFSGAANPDHLSVNRCNVGVVRGSLTPGVPRLAPAPDRRLSPPVGHRALRAEPVGGERAPRHPGRPRRARAGHAGTEGQGASRSGWSGWSATEDAALRGAARCLHRGSGQPRLPGSTRCPRSRSAPSAPIASTVRTQRICCIAPTCRASCAVPAAATTPCPTSGSTWRTTSDMIKVYMLCILDVCGMS